MTDTRKEFGEWKTKRDIETNNSPIMPFEIWEACQSLNDKRIQQLLAVIELQREALKMAYDDVPGWVDKTKEALAITPESVELVEVTHLKFRAVLYGGNHEHGPESHEWLEECSKGDVGDDGLEAFPVYTIKQKGKQDGD